MSEGIKHDAGKLPMDLIPHEAIIALAAVLRHGEQTYGRNNWRKGMKWSRLIAACLRHLWAWIAGEEKDAESGLPHLWHALCCLAFLVAYRETKIGDDDRWKRVENS